MKSAAHAVFLAVCFSVAFAPPPRERVQDHAGDKDKVENVNENEVYDALELEYSRYLQQVVQTLEGDEKFRAVLESVNPEDIKNGKIAGKLDLVGLNVRSKLDEIKRAEVDRLRQLAMLNHERNEGYENGRVKVPGHVDYIRPDKFGQEDLRKLMQQTHRDLEEADRKRKEEFKRYEMEKQYKFQHDLEKLPEEEKKKLKEQHEQQEKKHKEHPRIHHPGSKQQLEEVWEKQDHLDPQDFNPKTLFYMHDLDGNGYLDQEEIKLLFHNEIRKAYSPDAPEDDMREMEEDLERMREHVFNESDSDRDALISFDEFMTMVKKPEFEEDPEWHGVEDEEVFSEQEFMEYERLRQEEFARMQAAGHLPPPPMGHAVPPPHEYYGYQGPPIPQHGVPVPQGYAPQGVQQPHYQQQAQYVPQGAQPHAYQQVPAGQVPQHHGQPQMQQYQQVQQPAPGQQHHQQPVPVQQHQQPGQAQPQQVPQQVPQQPAQPQQVPQQAPPAGGQGHPVGQAPQVQQQQAQAAHQQQQHPSVAPQPSVNSAGQNQGSQQQVGHP